MELISLSADIFLSFYGSFRYPENIRDKTHPYGVQTVADVSAPFAKNVNEKSLMSLNQHHLLKFLLS